MINFSLCYKFYGLTTSLDYLEIPYLISVIGDSKFKIILKDFKKHIINYLFKKL